MGKVRAVANGNILDEADVHESLIAAGIYERIDGDGEATPQPPVDNAHVEPGAEQFDADTAVAPMTTADMPTKKGKAKA